MLRRATGFAKCVQMRLRRDWICSKHIRSLQPQIPVCRDALRAFLGDARFTGKTVGAYGAAAKGNTLLNYCGIRTGMCTGRRRNPHKQGQLLPGSHIPIVAPEVLMDGREAGLCPDFALEPET